MRARLTILWGAMLLVPIAFGQAAVNDFPDTPQNHWVYESIADLQSEGVLVGYPDGLGPATPPSGRYPMAVKVDAAFTRLHGIADSLRQEGVRTDRSIVAPAFSQRVKRESLRWSAGIIRTSKKLVALIEFFAPELRSFESDPVEMVAQVRRDIVFIESHSPAVSGIEARPFSDVPSDHWAAEAVRNLRAEGILKGYPDGKFGR